MDSKKITFSVTNDLVFDQRMQRICTTLHNDGYDVLLIGRKKKNSLPIINFPFKTHRMNLFFEKGKLFYIEYNIRLFLYLLIVKTDVFCAIDLDSILPNLFASKIRGRKRVYDAHELFCEMEEIIARPMIHKAWKWIEQYSVPKFKNGYTIGAAYAQEFKHLYKVDYKIVRNATRFIEKETTNNFKSYLLYQGAVNEGRCFEELIPAMKFIDRELIICGAGNFMHQTEALIKENNLSHKVHLKGYIKPEELKKYTAKACLGLTLFSTTSKSNFLSLANRFFDYMHYGVPQIAPLYPEYQKINNEFEIAILIESPKSMEIAKLINTVLKNEIRYNKLHQNTLSCAQKYSWQQEELTLIQFYKTIFE
jgi:glycosyltransferase involved in cell wall biosynthesis